MSQIKKLRDRLLSKPTDFTWQQLVKLLRSYGYEELEKEGSRKCFEAEGLPRIRMHKPHPGNVLKAYQVREIIDLLKRENLL